MTAYEIVKLARAKNRATAKEFIVNTITDFVELHGDRRFADDSSIISGIGMLGNLCVTVIAIEKGKDTKEKVKRNFGSVHPEGYRKALRQMKLAEKFKRPILCFVDTAGAYCGIGAEERGQGQAIAENLMEMMTLKTPILSVLIGEGGSGGALALSVADEVWMLENAVYSVISPEGCASILWKDSQKAAEAAACLKITANHLLDMKIVEKIVEEPSDFSKLYSKLSVDMEEVFKKLLDLDLSELLEHRYQKFRQIGAVNNDSNCN